MSSSWKLLPAGDHPTGGFGTAPAASRGDPDPVAVRRGVERAGAVCALAAQASAQGGAPQMGSRAKVPDRYPGRPGGGSCGYQRGPAAAPGRRDGPPGQVPDTGGKTGDPVRTGRLGQAVPAGGMAHVCPGNVMALLPLAREPPRFRSAGRESTSRFAGAGSSLPRKPPGSRASHRT
jgi:hypothetical protein